MERVLAVLMIISAIFMIVDMGHIVVQAVEMSVSSQVQVTVTVLPAYNLSLNLNIFNNRVYQGSMLFFVVELRKTDLVEKLAKRIYVNLSYEITQGNKIVKSGFLKTVYINKYDREAFYIQIPYNFSSGYYTLNVTATHPQAYTASDTGSFTVRRR